MTWCLHGGFIVYRYVMIHSLILDLEMHLSEVLLEVSRLLPDVVWDKFQVSNRILFAKPSDLA